MNTEKQKEDKEIHGNLPPRCNLFTFELNFLQPLEIILQTQLWSPLFMFNSQMNNFLFIDNSSKIVF